MVPVKGRGPEVSNDQGLEKQAIAPHLNAYLYTARSENGTQRAIQSLVLLQPHDHGKRTLGNGREAIRSRPVKGV